MCRTKLATDASEPIRSRLRSPSAPASEPPRSRSKSTSPAGPSITTSSSGCGNGVSSSVASRSSLSSLRESLPENPHIYEVAEIRAATNNFLAPSLLSSSSSSSSTTTASWRCKIRGKEAVVFQRTSRRRIVMDELRDWLSVTCRSHHGSIINLLGASIGSGVGGSNHIYLVYEYVHGATLAECLRNPKNPNFTVLSTWISRIRIATDLAHGLDYIHNKTGLKIRNIVHNYINSSAIIVTEPDFNAKICHFGNAQLCGETDEMLPETDKSGKHMPSGSREVKFEGVIGYMSPEFRSTGIPTQKSDIYAFGVTLLELLSGEEPLNYKLDKSTRNIKRTSVIETATVAINSEDARREGELRRWMDQRLKDSFPVPVAEKLTRLALECVGEDQEKRPEMGKVAGKISKLYLESQKWWENMKPPADFTVSMAPR